MFRNQKIEIDKTIDFDKNGFFTMEPKDQFNITNLSLEDVVCSLERLSDCTREEIIRRLSC